MPDAISNLYGYDFSSNYRQMPWAPNNFGTQNLYETMPWASNSYGMQNQYGAMPDASSNYMQNYSYIQSIINEEAEAKAKEKADKVAKEQKAAEEAEEAKVAKAQAQAEVAKVKKVKTTEDLKDDGKISARSKGKNFLKGIGNFFKGMVCDKNGKFSLKKTLTTVGIAAGAAVLTVATGGAATPFLIAAGVAMGGVQVAKGAIKASKAKTDKEAEEAWQDIGAGTTGVVLSVAGAKGALKSAGVAPKGGAIRSTIQCFGETIKGSPIKGLAKAPSNIARIFGSKNIKSNVIERELYPIESKLQIAERQLARQERRMDNIIGRQADPKKIAQLKEEIAILKAKKLEIEAYKPNIPKSKVDAKEARIQKIEANIKAKEKHISVLKNEKKIKNANKELEALNEDLKIAQNEYQTIRNYYKYDRINEIRETGTRGQRIWANSQIIIKNTSLANKRYIKPAFIQTQPISGQILRLKDADGIVESYIDAKTGEKLDPSILTKEQREKAELISTEEFEKILKNAETEQAAE